MPIIKSAKKQLRQNRKKMREILILKSCIEKQE